MKATRVVWSFVLVAVACGGGCGSSTPTSWQGVDSISPSLVMAEPAWQGGGAWQVDPNAWEFSRHDEALSVDGPQTVYELEWTRMRTADWQRTNNGRPDDSSRTLIRTLTERLSY